MAKRIAVLPDRAAGAVRPDLCLPNRLVCGQAGVIALWPMTDVNVVDILTGTVGTNTSAVGPLYAATPIGDATTTRMLALVGNAGGFINTNRSLPRTPITLSAWLRYSDLSAHYIVGSGSATLDWQYNASGQFSFTMRGVWDDTVTYALNVNQTYHVAVSFDGTTCRHYVDGVQIGSSTPGAVSAADGTIYLFASGAGGAGEATTSSRLTSVSYHNRALSADEMLRLATPPSRWAYYMVPGRRVFFDVGAPPAATVYTYSYILN